MGKRGSPRTIRRPRQAASSRSKVAAPFDLERMSQAIREVLEAAGIDVRRPEVSATPQRVARAWTEDFLDGYAVDPARVLESALDDEMVAESPAGGLVVVKRIPFHGLCPHHLLPYHGLAHIGYLPGRRLAPLSSLVRLLDCFAHRLELQETVTRQVAEALTEHLEARGAATVLESEQTCMTLRGVKRRGARTVTRHFAGELAAREDLRREFLDNVQSRA